MNKENTTPFDHTGTPNQQAEQNTYLIDRAELVQDRLKDFFKKVIERQQADIRLEGKLCDLCGNISCPDLHSGCDRSNEQSCVWHIDETRTKLHTAEYFLLSPTDKRYYKKTGNHYILKDMNNIPEKKPMETYEQLKERLSQISDPVEREATEFATLNFDRGTDDTPYNAAYEGVLHGHHFALKAMSEGKETVGQKEPTAYKWFSNEEKTYFLQKVWSSSLDDFDELGEDARNELNKDGRMSYANGAIFGAGLIPKTYPNTQHTDTAIAELKEEIQFHKNAAFANKHYRDKEIAEYKERIQNLTAGIDKMFMYLVSCGEEADAQKLLELTNLTTHKG